MKIKYITQILIDSYEKDIEDRLWQLYLVDYSAMDKSNYINFEDYKKKAFESNKTVQSKESIEEILRKAEEIKKIDQRGEIEKIQKGGIIGGNI